MPQFAKGNKLYENSNQNPPELQVDFRQNRHGFSFLAGIDKDMEFPKKSGWEPSST